MARELKPISSTCCRRVYHRSKLFCGWKASNTNPLAKIRMYDTEVPRRCTKKGNRRGL